MECLVWSTRLCLTVRINQTGEEQQALDTVISARSGWGPCSVLHKKSVESRRMTRVLDLKTFKFALFLASNDSGLDMKHTSFRTDLFGDGGQ